MVNIEPEDVRSVVLTESSVGLDSVIMSNIPYVDTSDDMESLPGIHFQSVETGAPHNCSEV